MDTQQGFGVDQRVSVQELQREVVGSVFAFGAQVPSEQPGSGVEIQQRFQRGLYQIPQVVVAADVA